jgi:uncharacterized membrane protein YccC
MLRASMRLGWPKPVERLPKSNLGLSEFAMTSQGTFSPLGFPAASWAFAIRIWIAAIVALYLSFWLQLEAPFSAMLTVVILAEPTRGQALEKAGYRLIATIIGVVASIVLTGLFSQTRDLLLLAFAAWLGVCVYVAGLLDGYRAYAGVLSGYTVGFLAAQQIDNPGHVFESSMARGAAIVIGVISVTVVNDLLSAPDRHPRLAAQFSDIHRRVREYAKRAICGNVPKQLAAASLMAEVMALRPGIAGLAVESSNGPARSAAAHNAAAALIAEIHTARTLNGLPIVDPTMRERAMVDFERGDDRIALEARAAGDSDEQSVALAWSLKELLRRDQQVRESLDAMESGRQPLWHWQGPLYRSHSLAAENGVRAAIWFLLAAIFFVYAGWPAASSSFSFVAVVIGLGSIAPNPRGMTTVALAVSPVGIISAGVLEFLILDGVSDFPLLAIALAPFMIGGALLIASPKPVLSAFGRLGLVFVVAILSPSNPQTYNPQSFIFASVFFSAATGIVFAAQLLVSPVSNDRRHRWLATTTHRDLHELSLGEPRLLAEEEMFRDAVRIGQIVTSGGASPNVKLVEEALHNFDRSSIIRLCDDKLRELAGRLSAQVAAARLALLDRRPYSLVVAARALREAAPQDSVVADLSAALLTASYLFAVEPRHEALEEAA